MDTPTGSTGVGPEGATRKSTRENFGLPPERLGAVEYGRRTKNSQPKKLAQNPDPGFTSPGDFLRGESTGNQNPRTVSDSQASISVPPRSTRTNRTRQSAASSARKLRAEAELEAMNELLKIDAEEINRTMELHAKLAESKRKLVEKKLEAAKAIIADELDRDDSDNEVDDPRDAELLEMLGDKGSHKSEQVKDWAEKARVTVPSPVPSENSEHSVVDVPLISKNSENINQKVVAVSDPIAPPPIGREDKLEKFLARQTTSRDLPQFSGNPIEWPNFISEFKNTSDICGYSKVENMTRLRKCLKGRARDAVLAMMVVPENVDKVIKVLERNFGRSDVIVETLIDVVQKVPSTREDKPETLVDLSNAVLNLTTTIETLKEPAYLMNPQLIKGILGKLPPTYRMQWIDYSLDAKGADLHLLCEWLEKIADKASRLVSYKSYDQKTQGEKNPKGNRNREMVFAVAEDSESGKETKKCLFCDKSNHWTSLCKQLEKETIEKRWTWAREKKICFQCLKTTNHRAPDCKDKKECGKEGCKLNHHPLLHKNKVPRNEESSTEATMTINSSFPHYSFSRKVFLKIVPVTLWGPAGKMETYAMFDDCSTTTLIHPSVAKKLGAEGKKINLRVKWMDSTFQQDTESRFVNLQINAGHNGSGQRFDLFGYTKNNLDLPSQSVNAKILIKKWKHLRTAEFPSLSNAKPTILIGQNHGDLISSQEILEGPEGTPLASRTKLGWAVHGPSTSASTEEYSCHIFRESGDEELHRLVKESFQTENFGVKIPKDLPKSKDDIQAQKIINATVCRSGGRWKTGLLWKEDDVTLPPSRDTAMRRLSGIERKIDKDKIFAEKYCQKISEYIDKGYARKLTSEEKVKSDPKLWYLPHFGVINENKPGKLRLVFDAAAKSNGVSLNDKLLAGPDLLCPLVSVLFKFRQRKIGFSGDIADMFHQIVVREEDLPSQRFLWRGMDRCKTPDEMVMTVMTFGATCSPTLAQVAKNRNAEEFSEEFPEAAKAITDRHYVDDYLDSTDDEASAIKLIREVTEVHRRGGFQIRGWTSSSSQVLREITTGSGKASCVPKIFHGNSVMPMERVLGLHWDPNSDQFKFLCNFHKVDPAIVNGTKTPTKREALRLVMSIFDPLGLAAHFTVKAKIILQDIWRCGIGWDDEVPDVVNSKWRDWLEELQLITGMLIPRCYSVRMKYAEELSLHVFCDASEQAFCAVAYLRTESEDFVDTSFVMAKTRVAPVRPMSIPRLELQAAVLGTRIAETIKREHEIKITNCFFWSDSRTVLCWIRSDARKYKPFVAHRVGEILETTDVSDWRWVPTLQNVADEATRDAHPSDFSKESRWLNGPDFIKLSIENWPVEKETRLSQDELNDLEEKPDLVNFCAAVKDEEDTDPEENDDDADNEENAFLPKISKFSNYKKLIRCTAWMLRFLNRFVRQCREKRTRTRERKALVVELTPEEIEAAEKVWWKKSQSESFSKDLMTLVAGKTLPKRSKLFSISPQLDKDGLLRLRGRLENGKQISQDTKRPILLDGKHPLTRLLVMDYHVKFGHHGRETILNEIRQRFWITKMRAAVKKCWLECQTCKNNASHPQPPEMGQLPEIRLEKQGRPFQITGLDYWGPMEVTVGRRREKRYGALFTCLSTRAVHLELVNFLNTDSVIMAIRRFAARRGQPKEIHSDNGTNFHGAVNELRKSIEELDQTRLELESTSKGMKWFFIPSASPHMGGAWERLVRAVKVALRATLKEIAPREETLRTLLAEAEHTVNCRPLTHVSLDPMDEEALTPNHFILGSSSGLEQIGVFEGDFCSRKQWRISQNLADYFWRRWLKEYLPSLINRRKWHDNTKPVKVGDVVIIVDEKFRRNCWPKGVVTAIYPVKDGIVRVVDVRTVTGTFRRPMAKICILDVLPRVKVNTSLYEEGDVPARNACGPSEPAESAGRESGRERRVK